MYTELGNVYFNAQNNTPVNSCYIFYFARRLAVITLGKIIFMSKNLPVRNTLELFILVKLLIF